MTDHKDVQTPVAGTQRPTRRPWVTPTLVEADASGTDNNFNLYGGADLGFYNTATANYGS